MANINIRISEGLKGEFYKKCKDNMQTPSIVLRKLIEEYIKSGPALFTDKNSANHK